MKFTVTVEDGEARRTFDAGETLDALDEVLENVRDFLEAADADPQAALDDEEED